MSDLSKWIVTAPIWVEVEIEAKDENDAYARICELELEDLSPNVTFIGKAIRIAEVVDDVGDT